MLHSSIGYIVAHQGAGWLKIGHSVAQGAAASLSKVQCSSVRCSLAQWKDIRPWRPELGPEGKHFVSGNRLFLFLKNNKQRNCDGWGGKARSAPFCE
jgi:hypothetical protein